MKLLANIVPAFSFLSKNLFRLNDNSAKDNLIKILLALFGLLIFLVFIRNTWIPIGMMVFLFLLVFYERSFLLVFILVSFLTLTSTISPELRLIIQVINLVLLVYFFIKDRQDQTAEILSVPKDLIILSVAIICSMLLSTLFSSYRTEGLSQVFRSLVFLVLIYLIFNQIKTDKDVNLIIKTLIAVALFYSVYLFYELYENNFVFISVQQQLTNVYGGEYLHKNFLGGFISINILLLMTFLFKPETNKTRYIGIIIIMLFGVIMTNARAAVLSLFISVFILLYILNKRLLVKFLTISTLIVLILMMTPVAELITIYMRFESISTGRDVLTESAFEVIKNHFLFGAGPAATRHEMYNHLLYFLSSYEETILRINYESGKVGQAHNFYLFFFSDLGIIGFVISILFPVLYFTMTSRLIKYYQDRKTDLYFLSRGFLVVGVFIFTRALFEPGGIFSYGNLNQDLPFWIILLMLSFYYSKIPVYEQSSLL